MRKFIVIGATGLGLLTLGAIPALAAAHGMHPSRGGVIGTVSAISGTTITLAGKNGTTYTIDASSAKVMKATTGKPVSATTADIAVGDTLAVMGPVSGTSVTAKMIFDGVMTGPKHFGGPLGQANTNQTNTNRIVGGTISAISGSDLTIAPKARQNATTTPASVTVHSTTTTVISKDGQAIDLSGLAVGQQAIVSGAKQSDGSIDASRIFIRTASSTLPEPFAHVGKRGKGGDNDNDGD